MSAAPLKYDPYAPGFFQNPYPLLDALREEAPDHRLDNGMLILLRYEEAKRYLEVPGTSVSMSALPVPEGALESMWQPAAKAIINQDPPDHTRLRKMVMQAFTGPAIERLRPMIVEQYKTCFAAFEKAGGGDFVNQIAFTLPYRVVCEMLGVTNADGEAIKEKCLDVTKAIVNIENDPETTRIGRAAYEEMTGYFRDLIAAKRADMDDKLLSSLIRAEEDGRCLSDEELVDQVALMFIGGFDSVISMLGSGLYLLLTHPEEARKWRQDPAIAKNGVEEIIRFEPPVLFGGRRIATADMDLNGIAIPSGAVVLACAGSANRDPRFWGDDAGVFRIDRKDPGGHLTFGGGIHRCMGNLLARMQGQIVLTDMLQRFPNMRLREENVSWKTGTHQRSLVSLQVEL